MNKKLIAYRKILGFSQTYMAKLIGISLTSYCQKERCKSDFTQTEMLKIINIIKEYNDKVTIDEIFFGNNVSIPITV